MVVLSCISLMIKDVEHFFKCFLAILNSSVRIPCLALYPILIGLFDSLEFNFLRSLYILNISPLSNVGLVKIFSKSVGCHFVFLTVSFSLKKHFQFYDVTFVNYCSYSMSHWWSVKGIFSCGYVFKVLSLFLFY